MNMRRPSLPHSLPPAGPEPKVKGVAFRSVLAVLEQIRGEAAVQAMLERMSSDQAHTLRYTIVQTGWYPISLYRALWSEILWDTPENYEPARTVGAARLRSASSARSLRRSCRMTRPTVMQAKTASIEPSPRSPITR